MTNMDALKKAMQTIELRDGQFRDLLTKAAKGQLMCQKAIINMGAIRPATDYVPEITPEMRESHQKLKKDGKLVPLWVYEKDGAFIMSDDYTAYTLYKEENAEVVPCVVLGTITSTAFAEAVGEPCTLQSIV
jgi:hypothetical protein